MLFYQSRLHYDQYDNYGVELMYGLEDEDAMIQEAGMVQTPVSILIQSFNKTYQTIARKSARLPEHIPTRRGLILAQRQNNARS